MAEITKEISEIAGVFAADGCMQKNYICFWGNSIEDREYYDTILKPFFKKSFKVELRIHDKKNNGVYGFYICEKYIRDFFEKVLNFKPGKKTYNISTPTLILKNSDPEIQKAFIRGYASADGGLNFYRKTGKYSDFKRKFHYYPRELIVSTSSKIIEEINNFLVKNGIKSHIEIRKAITNNTKDCFVLVINGKKEVEKYAKIVGFSNPKDSTKMAIFKRYGFCPTKTSINQRYRILNNELDINSLYRGP